MCPTDGVVVKRWLYYKEQWLQQVYDLAVEVNATFLLYKTTNFICDDIRTGDWSKYTSLYRAFDNATINACAHVVESLTVPYNLTQYQVYDYCRNGQFTEHGVERLNRQIVEFVNKLQESSSIQLTAGIYNDHDVESCNSTTDAIHHHFNMALRIRLLANIIDSYSKCT